MRLYFLINMTDTKTHIIDRTFTTESGFTFPKLELNWKSWGTLNEQKNNVVVICHALTGNAAADDWFSGVFASGSPIDLSQYYVICINAIGSCYGSTGPWSTNSETGAPYKNTFPEVTIRDIVRSQQLLLDELGITGIELVIGASMGGMTALEFAIMDPRVRAASVIAMGKCHSPWAIGISHAQRSAIYADAKWNNGDYERDDPPAKGLAAARMMAMITYRTAYDYEKKFGRNVNQEKGLYQVESYLNYQGSKIVDRFDAYTYDRLSKAMDSHDVSRGRGTFEEALGGLNKPIQVIGITSDRLYPIYEQRELAQLLPNSEYAEIESDYGHDAFLIEFEQLNTLLTPFIQKHR